MKITRQYRTPDRLMEFVRNLERLDVYVRDGKTPVLQDVEWVYPLSVIPLVAYAASKGVEIDFSNVSGDLKTYLQRIKFPCGTNSPRDFGGRTLPICRVSKDKKQVLEELEKRILNKLNARVGLQTAVQYLISEIQDNVWEHSQSREFWISGEAYNKPHNHCEICIADTGIGILKSYEGTDFEVGKHHIAVDQALKGVSAKSNERGAGLPSVAGILTECFKQKVGGEFMLMSGDAMFYIYKKKKIHYSLPIVWMGTIALLRFPVPSDRDVNIYEYFEKHG